MCKHKWKGVKKIRIESLFTQGEDVNQDGNNLISEIDARIVGLENKIDNLITSLQQTRNTEQESNDQEETEKGNEEWKT